jgi:hypothetical protein
MRVFQVSERDALSLSIALRLGGLIVLGMMLLSVVILVVHRLMRWLGGSRQWVLLAAILIAVYPLTFVAEVAYQMMRASGDLTASDATGFLIDNGQMTSHGWETIARRAAAAAALAGIVAASFGLVRFLTRRCLGP